MKKNRNKYPNISPQPAYLYGHCERPLCGILLAFSKITQGRLCGEN